MSALWEKFGRPLPDPPGTTVTDAEPLLSREDEQEVRARLDDIDRARAAAISHAHEYVIWR